MKFKRFFCNHLVISFVQNVHDEHLGEDIRSVWKCDKCGKNIFLKNPSKGTKAIRLINGNYLELKE